jgi:small conductance mechanosensitive channel
VTSVLASPIPRLLAEESPSPAPGPSCLANSDACELIYRYTKITWLAESGYWLLVKPLTILVILLVALFVRAVVHRAIDRLIRGSIASEDRRNLFRPLRARIPGAFAAPSERREQRARALGSILRSVASVTIFSVALMLVLGEVGVDLAPIIASAGIVGLAVGFGAQNLVKDFLAGLFMLLEDQYGVGDVIDVGDVTGTVEAVGLRITTIRDVNGVLWYMRNGEIVRVGNKSQGWALVIVDVPVGFVAVDQAAEVLRAAATTLADDPDLAEDIISEPEVLGVEKITQDGAVLRTTVKTASKAQWRVGRELRRRLTDALDRAGIAAQINAGRVYVRRPAGDGTGDAAAAGNDTGAGGPT